MVSSIWAITKKIFSLTLILNSLVTLACVAQIMYNNSHAFPCWQPYSPYLVNGNVFFLVIVGALVNIFPSASVGQLAYWAIFVSSLCLWFFCLVICLLFLWWCLHLFLCLAFFCVYFRFSG